MSPSISPRPLATSSFHYKHPYISRALPPSPSKYDLTSYGRHPPALTSSVEGYPSCL